MSRRVGPEAPVNPSTARGNRDTVNIHLPVAITLQTIEYQYKITIIIALHVRVCYTIFGDSKNLSPCTMTTVIGSTLEVINLYCDSLMGPVDVTSSEKLLQLGNEALTLQTDSAEVTSKFQNWIGTKQYEHMRILCTRSNKEWSTIDS